MTAAFHGRILLRTLFERFQSQPHAIVRWTFSATPRDFGSLAPEVVEHASRGDPAGVELMRLAARHVDEMAARLISHGVERLSLVGGLAVQIEPWLSEATTRRLVPPAGDALEGALRLARDSATHQPCPRRCRMGAR